VRIYHIQSIRDEHVDVTVDDEDFLWKLSTMLATRLHPQD